MSRPHGGCSLRWQGAMNTVDLQSAQWFKSSYSNGNGECVEVAHVAASTVATRDSKEPEGNVVVSSAHAWGTLLAWVAGR